MAYWFPIAAITDCHEYSGFQTPQFLSRFCTSEANRGVPGLEQGVCRPVVFFEAVGQGVLRSTAAVCALV